MPSYDSRITVESKTVPGVTFTIRKVSVGRRIEYNEKAAALDEAHRKALLSQLELESKADMGAFAAYVQAVQKWGLGEGPLPVPPEGYERWMEARQKVADTDAKRTPSLLHWGLHSITGLTLNGNEKPTVQQLIEEGPPELADEIVTAIRAEKDLPADLAKNSQSPSTSAASEGGSNLIMIAAPASSEGDTRTETAASTSQTVSA